MAVGPIGFGQTSATQSSTPTSQTGPGFSGQVEQYLSNLGDPLDSRLFATAFQLADRMTATGNIWQSIAGTPPANNGSTAMQGLQNLASGSKGTAASTAVSGGKGASATATHSTATTFGK